MSQAKTIELAKAVLENDRGTLSALYHWYREQVFEQLKRKFPQESEVDLEETFHKAFLTTIKEYIKNGRVKLKGDKVENLELLNAAAMIYTVAKRIMLKVIRGRDVGTFVPYEEYLDAVFVEEEETEEERLMEKQRVMRAFGQLRPLCQDLISSKLVHGFRFKKIAIILAEEGGEVLVEQTDIQKATTKRRQENFRCLKQLKAYYHALSTPLSTTQNLKNQK